MKAITIEEFGGPENLKVQNVDKPEPGPGEILIRVAAAGINYADIARRKGAYLAKTTLPYVLGLEAAGTVEALGPDVNAFKGGDRVLAILNGGGYAEYAVATAEQVERIPEELPFPESTAILVQGMTALSLLAEAKAGQSILIHAAAGGVGSLLVQLAKLKGLMVVGTASSTEKLQKVLALGADRAINYTEEDWTDEVLEATSGRGVDIVIEMVGGEIVGKNLQVLAVNGTMWVYGSASGENYSLPVLSLLGKNHTVRGYWLALEKPERREQFAKELIEHIGSKRLQVSVTEYPLEKAADAHRAIEGRKTTGKVVLKI
jgi:NADPH:quinone reductase